jgi:hypothetical protein
MEGYCRGLLACTVTGQVVGTVAGGVKGICEAEDVFELPVKGVAFACAGLVGGTAAGYLVGAVWPVALFVMLPLGTVKVITDGLLDSVANE